MSLNETPSGQRVHIGFFGLRNAGKSSLVNAVTNQELSIVSAVEGTTTDPVRKAMELLPLGPVVIIDTPGIDDAGELGGMRVRKAVEVLRRCDVAVLAVDATRGLADADRELISAFEERKVPYIVALTKTDLLEGDVLPETPENASACIATSALTGAGIERLKEALARIAEDAGPSRRLLADLIDPGDHIVFVVPIDESAPAGRLILPQQMALRDVLDVHATCSVCQPDELAQTLELLTQPPRLVVTDSQAFGKVAAIVPEDVPLTSYSILMARYKGTLEAQVAGVKRLESLADGDRVLVAEGCTHHRQCGDIGTVKLPALIKSVLGAEPSFEFTSGNGYPDDLQGFSLVLHCGGCMLNEREMAHRMRTAAQAGVPVVNYGMALARLNGVLYRALAPLGIEPLAVQ